MRQTFGETAGGYYADGRGNNWLVYPFSPFYRRWQTWRCAANEFDWS